MKRLILLSALLPTLAFAEPSLTLYNQNFAVVRENVSLDLKQGVNDIRYSEVSWLLEPDSVILRDPSGKVSLQILEQNYRNDPVSESMLLSLHEGRMLDFQTVNSQGQTQIIQGKVIRSGFVSQDPSTQQRYGHAFYQNRSVESQPIIEVDGKLQFSLPGKPLFPALNEESVLKPTLTWKINVDAAGKVEAELAYITGGMTWEADYNVVAPEAGDTIDFIGWITMDNQSGRTYENAQIKLMAGDVSKVQPRQNGVKERDMIVGFASKAAAPQVEEKSFDEFHLYTLQNRVTLRNKETKQVEFLRASGVKSHRVYIYDGLQLDANQMRHQNREYIRNNEGFGTESHSKIAVVQEFKNTKENQLGIPLPKGRVRFYRQDSDKQLEFTGENLIDHTPQGETLRIFTGYAFDLVGSRIRTDFKRDDSRRMIEESFEITLRNRKKEAVEIQVVEHLFRWMQWEITETSDPFVKKAAQVIEYRVKLKPDEERKITYTVRYTW